MMGDVWISILMEGTSQFGKKGIFLAKEIFGFALMRRILWPFHK